MIVGSAFWQEQEIPPESIVYEDSLYLVIPAPALWRRKAKIELDRILLEYVIVNKRWGVVEGSANTLATVVMTVKSLTEQYNEFVREESKSANVVDFKGKNPTK